ncbi:MAG: FAD-dependent oxidoreductase [Rhodothermales bacterium]
MKRLAILGAGIAGLGAAWALRNADIEIDLFEKSRGLGGRAATRGREDIRYDHGANYFSLEPEAVRHLVFNALSAEDLVQITRPVIPFGVPDTPGPPQPTTPPARWNYRHGISQLAKLISAASNARILNQTRIERLVRQDGWILIAEKEQPYGPYDGVLLAAPAPQSAVILESSEMDTSLRYRLAKALRQSRYESQLSFVLGFDEAPALDGEWYARVNMDRQQPLVWAAIENAKEGHVPAGKCVILAQMAPSWSARRYLESFDDLLPEVLSHLRALVPSLPDPAWHDGQRWRFARAVTPANAAELRAGAAHGLYFAGDALAEKSRVELALMSGLEAANRIAEQLG